MHVRRVAGRVAVELGYACPEAGVRGWVANMEWSCLSEKVGGPYLPGPGLFGVKCLSSVRIGDKELRIFDDEDGTGQQGDMGPG